MRPEFRAWNLSLATGTRGPRGVVAPAAGKEWSYTLPSGFLYRIDLARATFTASAQAAERTLGVKLLDPDKNVWWKLAFTAEKITAGFVIPVSYSMSTAMSGSTGGAYMNLQLPEFLIPGGWTVESQTYALQTEDTYTGIQLMLSSLFDDYPGRAPGALEGDHLGIDSVAPALGGAR